MPWIPINVMKLERKLGGEEQEKRGNERKEENIVKICYIHERRCLYETLYYI